MLVKMCRHYDTHAVNNDGEEGFYDGFPTLTGKLKKHLKGRNYINIFMKIRKNVSISLGPGVAQGAWKLHPSNFVSQTLFFNCQIQH